MASVTDLPGPQVGPRQGETGQPPPAVDPMPQKPDTHPQASKRLSKRLTINFPVLPTPQPLGETVASPSGSKSPTTNPRSSPRLPAQSSPTDATGFLTALASQERKVLELREELLRAETELSNLKKHWAAHEASRKKNELRNVERLQPLSAPWDRIDSENEGTSPSKPSVEKAERRAARRYSTTRKPKQRVFSGSRHTRTLSLLSPDALKAEPTPFPGVEEDPSPAEGVEVPPLLRSSTISSVTEDSAATFTRTYRELATARRSMPPAPREALVKTGKQMANDLRDGLWTFLEDIRQATVGDEGINGTVSRTTVPPASSQTTIRRQPSKVTPRDKARLGGQQKQTTASTLLRTQAAKGGSRGPENAVGPGSFWGEFGLDTPKSKASPTRPDLQTTSQPSLLDIDDNWDVWDSPTSLQKTHSPNPSSSTAQSTGMMTPATDQNSPRTSTSSVGDDTLKPGAVASPAAEPGALPWPALTNITPSKLTRTASNLMAEWEKSLSPPPALNEGAKKEN